MAHGYRLSRTWSSIFLALLFIIGYLLSVAAARKLNDLLEVFHSLAVVVFQVQQFKHAAGFWAHYKIIILYVSVYFKGKRLGSHVRCVGKSARLNTHNFIHQSGSTT